MSDNPAQHADYVRRRQDEAMAHKYWQSHVVVPALSADTVLYLEPTTPVHSGEILAMQSGEEVLVVSEPRLAEQGLAVQVIRGYRRSIVRPVPLLDAVWLVGEAHTSDGAEGGRMEP